MPPQRLRRCVGAGLLKPARDNRGRLRFDFVDLVLLRTMRGLLEKRVPVPQIGRILDSLRRQIGHRPLSELSVYADGDRVVAWDGASRWQPDSGQFLFNFDTRSVLKGANKVVALPPPRPRASEREVTAEEWYDLAIELEETSPVEARAAYEHALEVDADHIAARIDYGRLLHGEGDLAGAEREYREAARRDPESALAWYNLGVLLEDLERSGEAVPCYERAVRADPSLADAHYNLALLYEHAGRQRDAVRHFLIYRRLERKR